VTALKAVGKDTPISWNEFLEHVDENRIYVESLRKKECSYTYIFDYIYRGHSNAEWSLESSLDRYLRAASYENKEISFKRYLSIVESVSPALRTLSHEGFLMQTEIEESDEDYLTKNLGILLWLRHCGFPSPLLDWTKSAFVAAYFAFSGSVDANPVAVYGYRPSSMSGGWVDEANIFSIGHQIETHHRHFRQQCNYTYARRKIKGDLFFSSHEFAINKPHIDFEIVKYIIDGRQKNEVLRRLHEMNINEYTLFGSDDALVKMLAFEAFVSNQYAFGIDQKD